MASRAVNSGCEAQKKVSDSKKVGDIFITLHCYLTKLEEMCVIIYRGEYRLFAENYITFFIKFRKKNHYRDVSLYRNSGFCGHCLKFVAYFEFLFEISILFSYLKIHSFF